MLTLGQAAKETGISKPTISKAIKKGRISATRNEQGEYQIDPAELFRVYPSSSSQPVTTLQNETPIYTKDLQRDLELVREERTRERQQLEATIADLRAERERLLLIIEEQAGTVKQLTYQPAQANQNQLRQLSAVPRWLWAVLIAAVALAGSYAVLLRFGGV